MDEKADRHQQPGGTPSTRMALGAVGLTVSLLLVVAVAAAAHEPAASTTAVTAVLLALGVAGLLALTRTWRDPAVWLSVAGLVFVTVGSGIGRAREEAFEGGGARGGRGGDVVARLDTRWPLVALGAALVVGALVWLVVRTSADDRSLPAVATGSLAVLAAGIAGITVALAEVVVGEWVA